MYNPKATYRIQFHQKFTFKYLEKLIPYFVKLGVSTIYASPIFAAIPGSTHGYDTVDPQQLNPEIGTEQDLLRLSAKLKKNGIGWLQDIVPNHMSFHTNNAWLMDVLKKGKKSTYHRFFDLDFPTAMEDQRLMVPFLGVELEDEITAGNLKLVKRKGEYFIQQGDSFWPINEKGMKRVNQSLKTKRISALQSDQAFWKSLCDDQFYRLCDWQETEYQINYRRFFTVNSLICLRVEDQKVFTAYHSYVAKLVKLGVFQGLRIDHIDGLKDPAEYLVRLRELVGEETYIVAEKILANDETLPNDWNAQGTTGYDFLAKVNNVMTNVKAEQALTEIYEEKISKPQTLKKLALLKKRDFLTAYMAGEMNNLITLFKQVLPPQSPLHALPKEEVAAFVSELMVAMPVYRFYGRSWPLDRAESAALQAVLEKLPSRKKWSETFQLISDALLDASYATKPLLAWYQRCMQFSGPLTAKGIEDTLMYTYNRFVGHNDVGDHPQYFGSSIAAYQEWLMERRQQYPLAMNATSTHDTKRGEDVRARLNVLTDVPELWANWLKEFNVPASTVIHPNDAYHFLQVVIGAMPLEDDPGEFAQRMGAYGYKALREGKKRSSWPAPNDAYETTVQDYIQSIAANDGEFHQKISSFAQQIKDFGLLNSLVQLVLKFTSPGIPDLYQGTELWDFSLVDPDNRVLVDYDLRVGLLRELQRPVKLNQLWKERHSGKIKLWLTQRLLQLRKNAHLLFEYGTFEPLTFLGKYQAHLMGHLWRHSDECLLVIVPIGMAQLTEQLGDFDWEDTQLIWPVGVPGSFKDLLRESSGCLHPVEGSLSINSIFEDLPMAILTTRMHHKDRTSGVLLPLFSLPSDTGVGGFGVEARKFVDFLAATKQRYWQLLPLNPTTMAHGHSPYSSYSAMAGNPSFIDLNALVYNGWLKKHQVSDFQHSNGKVDYEKTSSIQTRALSLAYKGYLANVTLDEKLGFEQFCTSQSYWLDDFAFYVVLREHFDRKPWYEWPKEYKERAPKTLAKFVKEKAHQLQQVKWEQYVFEQQWDQLKVYAHHRGVWLMGDLPFYVAYDSADVWANPTTFQLDAQLQMNAVAGVPPDEFSDDGQLWGLPLFDWEKLKETNYQWWMDRLKRNMTLFDVLRLDHFRAFHSYWKVDAKETNAINGQWVVGPGGAFLTAIRSYFPEMPFVAEDLGDDMEEAMTLRAELQLPGMKVLQFGFGENMPISDHLPHRFFDENCVAYVGTHDNNTARGWFEQDASQEDKERLDLYLDKKVTSTQVHKEMMRLAMASNARVVILQCQDLCGAKADARMNTPGTMVGNWSWQLTKDQLHSLPKDWLLQMTLRYGRT